MQDVDLLQLCLNITGSFENGAPNYSSVTGNFDGQGLSVGILQWNAGQGSLQSLLMNIGGKMGWEKAGTFFKSDIHHLALLKPGEAIQFCLDHYIATGKTTVDPNALTAWKNFLSQPESIAAQQEMAINGTLYRAKTLAAKFCRGLESNTRVLAFFFDLVTQSGGMQNQKGSVDPIDIDSASASDAINLASVNNVTVAAMWQKVVDSGDKVAILLLDYAYKRSQLSSQAYVWDACARRGTIACRTGIVHGARKDFTTILD
jgi:hypothetical protein